MLLIWDTPGTPFCLPITSRTYLSQDIIMRVLRDYFNYDVVFVMNITDIDDKIINRFALLRHSYLLDPMREEFPSLSLPASTRRSSWRI